MNITSWDFYVEGKADWDRYKTGLKVELPKTQKTDTFLFKDKNGKEVHKNAVKNGAPVVLLSNKKTIIEKKEYATVRVNGQKGFLPISRLGKPEKNTTADEDIALGQLDQAIKKRVKGGGDKGICIIVKSGKKVAFVFMDCVRAKTRVGTPKSDFAIFDSKGRAIAEISHKKAGGAKAFQQYVSLNGRRRDNINNDPFVQDTLKRFAIRQDDISGTSGQPRVRFKKTIPFDRKGQTLMNRAIYGLDYTKGFGKEHVHFIGQGDPHLAEADPKDRPKDCSIAYELSFSDGLSVSGDLSHFKSNGFEPIIFARFSNGRFFSTLDPEIKHKDIRTMITPDALGGATAKEL